LLETAAASFQRIRSFRAAVRSKASSSWGVKRVAREKGRSLYFAVFRGSSTPVPVDSYPEDCSCPMRKQQNTKLSLPAQGWVSAALFCSGFLYVVFVFFFLKGAIWCDLALLAVTRLLAFRFRVWLLVAFVFTTRFLFFGSGRPLRAGMGSLASAGSAVSPK